MRTEDAIIDLMAKKKPDKPDVSKPDTSDRHDPTKERVTLRLRQDLREQLQKLVDYTGTDENNEIRIAIRERLEKMGFWPHKPDKKD
jgi:hypothetical protein